MKIDIKNYEIYVIDYLEGNLDSNLNAQFEAFLNLYPDIKNEILDLNSFSLEPTQNLSFKNKNSLKKVAIQDLEFINENNYNEYFIAFYERDLDESETKILMDFIELNPHTKADFELFSKIKIQPQEKLVFSNKNSLKRKSVFVNFNKAIAYASSVAAILLIGTTLLLLIPEIEVERPTISKAENRNKIFIENIETKNLVNSQKTNVLQLADNNSLQVAINSKKSVSDTKVVRNQFEVKQISPLNVSYLYSKQNFIEVEKRTEFTEAYKALLLKNQIYSPEIELEEPKDIVQNVISYSEDALSVFNKLRNDNQQIAKIGVESVNRLADRYNFYLKKNEDGNFTHLAINDFAIPLRRNR